MSCRRPANESTSRRPANINKRYESRCCGNKLNESTRRRPANRNKRSLAAWLQACLRIISHFCGEGMTFPFPTCTSVNNDIAMNTSYLNLDFTFAIIVFSTSGCPFPLRHPRPSSGGPPVSPRSSHSTSCPHTTEVSYFTRPTKSSSK